MKLKEIYFGEPEGKDEIRTIEAKNKTIEDIFYNGNSVFEKMKEPQKFLIIGRKGTGKTLLAEYYKSDVTKSKNFCEIYNESEFSLEKLKVFKYESISESEMTIFWKYFFYKTIRREVLNNNKFKKMMSLRLFLLNRVKEVSFELDSFEVTDSISRSGSAGGKFAKKPETSCKGNIEKTKVNVSQFKKAEYFKQIEEFERKIVSVLKNEKLEYNLIYDDLDELEELFKNEHNTYKFIHSMIKAVKEINDLFENKCDSNAKIFILLREDMSNDLIKNTNNYNKILNTNAIQLDWQYKKHLNDYEQDISKLFIRKIRQSNIELKFKEDKEVYENFFPKKVSSRSAVKFIIDHSYGRPRDFILFFNAMKDTYPNEERLKANMFSEVLGEYSKRFYGEFLNEVNRNPKKAEILECIDIIKSLHKASFHIDEVKDRYEQEKENYKYIKSSREIEQLFKELYLYSVIGTSYYIDGSGSKTKKKNAARRMEFYYRDNLSDNPLMETFSVHFAVRKALNI